MVITVNYSNLKLSCTYFWFVSGNRTLPDLCSFILGLPAQVFGVMVVPFVPTWIIFLIELNVAFLPLEDLE